VNIQALIFDVDGTLAETEEFHRLAFNQAFVRFGFSWLWDRELYKELLKVTGGKERILHYLSEFKPEDLDRAQPQIANIHQLKTQIYGEIMRQGAVELRPGVSRLIAEAQSSGISLAIATTTSPSNVHGLLQRTMGARGSGIFQVIVAGDEAPAKKPRPDAFEIALMRLGASVSECIALEDSANGVIAAQRAGLKVIATPGIYTADDNFTGASSVISDLGEPHSPHRHISGWDWPQGFVSVAALQERAIQGRACLRD
jgi:HAD superfamily hydrolase (TIGR01509 family)